MKVRLVIRGFIASVKVLEVFTEVRHEGEMTALAEEHATYLLGLPGGDLHMIEIEFLDEANPLERFFRIGTDPAGMIIPISLAERN